MFSSRLTSKRFAQNFIHHFAQNDNYHEIDIKNGHLGYGLIHYSLIRNLKPQKVLCIGSKYGFIPAICALACRDNQLGKVDFVDAGYDESLDIDKSRHWGGAGLWKSKQGRKQFNKFGLENYLQLQVMTTQQFFSKSKQKYEYIHLDGDHSYDGVSFDFKRALKHIKIGGIIALHDIFSTGKMNQVPYGVKKLWQEIKKSKKYNTLEIPGKYGLGIIQL